MSTSAVTKRSKVIMVLAPIVMLALVLLVPELSSFQAGSEDPTPAQNGWNHRPSWSQGSGEDALIHVVDDSDRSNEFRDRVSQGHGEGQHELADRPPVGRADAADPAAAADASDASQETGSDTGASEGTGSDTDPGRGERTADTQSTGDRAFPQDDASADATAEEAEAVDDSDQRQGKDPLTDVSGVPRAPSIPARSAGGGGCCPLPTSRKFDFAGSKNHLRVSRCSLFCPLETREGDAVRRFSFRGETKTGTSVVNMMLHALMNELAAQTGYAIHGVSQAGWDKVAYGFCGLVHHTKRVIWLERCRSKHEETAEEGDYVIMTIRDVRDAMVSYFHHFRKSLHGKRLDRPPDDWCARDDHPYENCTQAVEKHVVNPIRYIQWAVEGQLSGLYVIPFASLNDNKPMLMMQVARFLGFDLGKDGLGKALQSTLPQVMSLFDAKQSSKAEDSAEAAHIASFTRLRRGAPGAWKEELSEKDIEFITSKMAEWPLHAAWWSLRPPSDAVFRKPLW